MKISIVLTGNAGNMIRCAESINRQSHRDKEVDFAGVDSGLFYAVEAALATTGEYLCFINSKDCVSPFYLEKLLALCKEQEVKMAAAGCLVTDSETPVDRIPVPLMLYLPEVIDSEKYMELMDMPKFELSALLWGKLFHRSLFEGIKEKITTEITRRELVKLLAEKAEKIVVTGDPLYFISAGTGDAKELFS